MKKIFNLSLIFGTIVSSFLGSTLLTANCHRPLLEMSQNSSYGVSVWQSEQHSTNVIQAATVSNGVWSSPATISDLNHQALSPKIAIDSQGNAIVTWLESGSECIGNTLCAATLPSHSNTWSTPVKLSKLDNKNAEAENINPDYSIKFNDDGHAAITWSAIQASQDAYQIYSVSGILVDGTAQWDTPSKLSIPTSY